MRLPALPLRVGAVSCGTGASACTFSGFVAPGTQVGPMAFCDGDGGVNACTATPPKCARGTARAVQVTSSLRLGRRAPASAERGPVSPEPRA